MNYSDVKTFKPIIDEVVLKYDVSTHPDNFMKAFKSFHKSIKISADDIDLTELSNKKLEAYSEYLGLKLYIYSEKIEVKFCGGFFTDENYTHQEQYDKHHKIRKILDKHFKCIGVPKSFDIAIDTNIDVSKYYHEDLANNKTILNCSGFRSSVLDNKGKFKGTTYWRSSDKNKPYMYTFYDKKREIAEGNGNEKKVNAYKKKGYFDFEHIGRFEIYVGWALIKKFYLKEYYLDGNLDSFTEKVITHLTNRRRFYYNPTGKVFNDTQLKNLRYKLKPHPLFKAIFGKKRELENYTPDDCLFTTPKMKDPKDMKEDFVNLALKYNHQLTADFINDVFFRASLQVDEFIERQEERLKRRQETQDFLESVNPHIQKNEYIEMAKVNEAVERFISD